MSRTEYSREEVLAAISLSLGRRRGVNAGRKILAGEVIERSPVIVIPPREALILAESDVGPYLEPWPSEHGAAVLPLGFAAMYRDSADPNIVAVPQPDQLVMEIVAAVDIEAGDEMTVPRRWRISGWAPDQAQETDRPPANANRGDDG